MSGPNILTTYTDVKTQTYVKIAGVVIIGIALYYAYMKSLASRNAGAGTKSILQVTPQGIRNVPVRESIFTSLLGIFPPVQLAYMSRK